MDKDWFLASTTPLRPADAAVALLVLGDGRYLMQLGDQKPDIFYPGHWGLFGGVLEPGEDAAAALGRELREELRLENASPRFFSHFDFDLGALGANKVSRVVFEIALAEADLAGLVLAFPADELSSRE
jgi:8-oxo-dGTP pyrophosphatase MutT (NUDIX family)